MLSACFFFFNDTATTEIYTLSYTTLFRSPPVQAPRSRSVPQSGKDLEARIRDLEPVAAELGIERSEEHTSELQSRSDIVCRLLLEKNKTAADVTSAHPEPVLAMIHNDSLP